MVGLLEYELHCWEIKMVMHTYSIIPDEELAYVWNNWSIRSSSLLAALLEAEQIDNKVR